MASSGTKKNGLNDEVTLLMRSAWLCLGPTRGCHYNEVVLLKRWPLGEVSLYIGRLIITSIVNLKMK